MTFSVYSAWSSLYEWGVRFDMGCFFMFWMQHASRNKKNSAETLKLLACGNAKAFLQAAHSYKQYATSFSDDASAVASRSSLRRLGKLAGFTRASMTMHLCCCVFLCVLFFEARPLWPWAALFFYGFRNKTSDMTRHSQNFMCRFAATDVQPMRI